MGERMGKTELKLWRDRLGYVRKIYIRKGILGNQHSHDSPLRQMIDFYRGRQWEYMMDIDGLEDEFKLVVNRVFPIANGLETDVVATVDQCARLAAEHQVLRGPGTGAVVDPVAHEIERVVAARAAAAHQLQRVL